MSEATWRLVVVVVIIIINSFIYFFTPVLNSQEIKKLRYAIQKSTKIKLERTLLLLLLRTLLLLLLLLLLLHMY